MRSKPGPGCCLRHEPMILNKQFASPDDEQAIVTACNEFCMAVAKSGSNKKQKKAIQELHVSNA